MSLFLTPVQNINDGTFLLYKQLRENAFTSDNSFIADSPKVVNLLLESNVKIISILATKEYYDENEDLVASKDIAFLYIASKVELQTIVGHTIHHNCMAHGVRPTPTSIACLGNSILMLDAITSTENVGSIARSMAGFGVDSYMLSNLSPHPYARRSLRVSMGYISHLKYHIYTDIFLTLERLKQQGYKIFAAEVQKGSTPLWHVEVPKKWVLIMGHEGKGISPKVLAMCDEVVSIEMQENVKSFNVGVAASVMMYRFMQGS
ncbi:RNA methyltransferase [Sulfurimonas sp. SAG-AH-194-I05]|nr:RNA methyltransferase [Sulfurimonas sp. SAG-AH-194-I05]MDF1875154.1 RNA methyltransferase [Sulfurimonas sp. SAG-AH-194-I05]